MKKKKKNLIGLSGKMGHGKDTVGHIIQILTRFKKTEYTNTEHWDDGLISILRMMPNSDWDRNFSYENKKFADKLKDVVCLIIGCTRAQLEDRRFKEAPLGEEWRIWKLIPEDEFNPLEGACQMNDAIFKTEDELYKYIEEHDIINVGEVVNERLTPRKMLQLLGTEAGRNIIHPDIWVNALFADYKPLEKQQNYETEWGLDTYIINCKRCSGQFSTKNKRAWLCGTCVLGQEDVYPNWLITDVRFKTEVDAIKKRDGILVRINRPNSEGFDNSKIPHQSEIELDDYKGWNYVIENDGTLEDLIDKVKKMLEHFKII